MAVVMWVLEDDGRRQRHGDIHGDPRYSTGCSSRSRCRGLASANRDIANANTKAVGQAEMVIRRGQRESAEVSSISRRAPLKDDGEGKK